MPGQDSRALADSEQWLRAVFDGTYEHIGLLAPDGTLLEANRAALAFAETARENVAGRPLWETAWFSGPPGVPEQLRAAVARAAQGRPFRTEWTLRRPSGELATFDFSLRPVRDAGGQVVLIIAEGRDITGLGRTARYSEERFRLLFEQARDGIWLAGADGRFVDVNRAACRMLGYSRAEHLALTVADLVRPEDQGRLRALMDVLAGGHEVTDVWEIRRADGSYVPLELSHVLTSDGQWQASGRDITDRLRAQAERDRSDAARDRADAARDRHEAEREQRLADEHEIALVLQRSLLPPASELDGRYLAARYEPAVDALEIGGDWYDAVPLGGDRLAVAVGDVVGKGAAAAAVMGQLRSAARTLLLEGHGPARVLTALDAFAQRTPDARCSTMFCGVIDPAAGTVTYSSAGHPPAILDPGETADRGGQHYELLEGAQSVPLAVIDGLRRPEATVPLPPDSTLLLYTDGLVERRGEAIDVGIKAAAAVLSAARAVSPSECARLLAAELIAAAHEDDAAFLLYRQHGR